MGLGDRIRDIRLELGETMEEFGARFDTSKGTINNWEKDRNKPNKTNLKAIADVGKISVDELLYGDQGTRISVDDELLEKLNKFIDRKREVFKQEVKLLAPSALSGILTLGIGFKESREKAIKNYEIHRERIKELEKFGNLYIDENYDNYTYDKFLKDFPESDPQGFEEYKEKEWDIFEQILDNYWLLTDITDENYSWINERFTNQITEELNKVKEKIIEEGKEEYYVDEVVQPFLDQAAKDFKEYIKDYIDTEE